jgi:hypothetical protein
MESEKYETRARVGYSGTCDDASVPLTLAGALRVFIFQVSVSTKY